MKGNNLLLFLSGIALLMACNTNHSKHTQTHPTDSLRLWVDSSLSVLVNETRKSFENTHDGSVILTENKNEAQIINGLLKNEINTAVLHRQLSASEVDFFRKKEDFSPKQYIFAYDAYVFITHKDNPIPDLSVQDIQAYLISPEGKKFTLSVENSSSQSVQYIKTHFGLKENEVKSLYASKNVDTLMNYLRSGRNAIGIIPFSYISDINANSTIVFLKDLKVLPLSYRDSTGGIQSIFPSQETITTKTYPFISPIVLVNCNMSEKLGTTFVNFILKQKAQRLILKFGLCPAIFPGREIRIKTN